MPPEPPRIQQGDFLVTTEDREIELECVSAGGKPAAEVIQFDRLVIDFKTSKTHEPSQISGSKNQIDVFTGQTITEKKRETYNKTTHLLCPL